MLKNVITILLGGIPIVDNGIFFFSFLPPPGFGSFDCALIDAYRADAVVRADQNQRWM